MSVNNCPLTVKRHFSSSLIILREWKLVETRRIAKQPDFQIGGEKPLYIPKKRKVFPDYKYGESNLFKQSNQGLFGGSFIQFGNNISESKIKTRRTWLPNIIKKSLWSETLNKPITLKLTAKVLKTITKEGGIDNYLLKDKAARIKELGPTGWKLRYSILSAKDKQLNPPHKDAKTVTTNSGEVKKIYYDVEVNGKPFKITVGRRQLLSLLFAKEQLNKKCDGIVYSHKEFIEESQKSTISDILSKLDKYGYDLSTISL
ncbi:hypothetical protein TPHA_0D03610 [Tetrapisispora phaffii CBS 4417]|uniref:Large ribosomal subunit protein bL28m n=1 Tax=Tetrapisispora phaffii (strain ATCC 24235 / CBS 4417 / NBRC 1672 / NRRL Y-8282 / UCD 70-5) TaxID=1071381 RepID=G8BT25_TETPH|nr:mitochondrial 54S ribosomal protein YmL24/YmL14 TPHA_0D03610 [Tetrapisispora phaffii CBS 4417]CCE62996.1 hypothetical protein TPHA_0D03610 [Tetrapisispora phaffii CBS 4417]